jgi:tetratricopeptide (TPR) repeat protein
LLINQKKFAEAEPMCRDVLERRRRVLGDNHPDTLIANNVMGLVLRRQDRDAEAIPYVRETLAISRRVNGATHPDTFLYAHNLGLLLMDQKQPAEAESLLREVVQEGGAALGRDHAYVLSATNFLGQLLTDQKRDAEAIELYTPAEPFARKAYTGDDASDLSAFLLQFGIAHTHLKQYALAEPRLLEAYDIAVRTDGPASDSVIDTTESLGILYTEWEAADPGRGHDAKASEWKQKLIDAKPATTRASTLPTTSAATVVPSSR